jgi:hypothetical protein
MQVHYNILSLEVLPKKPYISTELEQVHKHLQLSLGSNKAFKSYIFQCIKNTIKIQKRRKKLKKMEFKK